MPLTEMTLTLPLDGEATRRYAAEMLAEFSRQCVGFYAEYRTDRDDLPVLRVTFTGAH